MKDWFLDKFPAFNEYHTKHAELIKNAQKAKEAKRELEARKKREAHRNALLAKKVA